MESGFASMMSKRRSGDAAEAKRRAKLSKTDKEIIARWGVKPWSPAPRIEEVVGYEKGAKKVALFSTFLSAMCELEGGEASPVLLFVGPPGVGKSYMAAAIARSIGMQAHVMKKNEIVSSYHHASENNFTKYILSKACNYRSTGTRQLIVIDEADLLFATRDESRDRSPLVCVFNEFVNGSRHHEIGDSIIFVLCMNRPDLVDESVISRSLVMRFPLPNVEETGRLLVYHSVARGIKVDRGVDFAKLARRVAGHGLSHRDIVHVVSTARAKAVLRENEGAEFDSEALISIVKDGSRVPPISEADFAMAIEEVASTKKADGDCGGNGTDPELYR